MGNEKIGRKKEREEKRDGGRVPQRMKKQSMITFATQEEAP